jgi:hypothetical protein
VCIKYYSLHLIGNEQIFKYEDTSDYSTFHHPSYLHDVEVSVSAKYCFEGLIVSETKRVSDEKLEF